MSVGDGQGHPRDRRARYVLRPRESARKDGAFYYAWDQAEEWRRTWAEPKRAARRTTLTPARPWTERLDGAERISPPPPPRAVAAVDLAHSVPDEWASTVGGAAQIVQAVAGAAVVVTPEAQSISVKIGIGSDGSITINQTR